jgi:hypothetical protein
MRNFGIKLWHPTDPVGFVFQPDLPHNFYRRFDVEVGYEDEDTSTTISVAVCTFTWLAHNYSREGPRWGRHLLVVGQYDAQEIKSAIEAQVRDCAGETWDETLKMLSRHFAWEYEDYKPKA